MVLDEQAWTPKMKVYRFGNDHDEFLRYLHGQPYYNSVVLLGGPWRPPRVNFVKVSVDDSFRRNASYIGGGGVLCGQWIMDL